MIFHFFCYYSGYYQPHLVYPQFYQTYPAVFARPIMGQPIESHQRNICKNNNGEVVPCYKSFVEKVDQSGIKPVISNVFKSISEKIQDVTKLPAFRRPVNPVFYSISENNEENSLVKGKFFSRKVGIFYSSFKQQGNSCCLECLLAIMHHFKGFAVMNLLLLFL